MPRFVDDNPTNVLILEEILSEPYRLQTASCGEEALALAQDYKPDLVLLDIMMPSLDGYETCLLASAPVLLDTQQMNAVVMALLENAIRFSTPEDCVRVALACDNPSLRGLLRLISITIPKDKV